MAAPNPGGPPGEGWHEIPLDEAHYMGRGEGGRIEFTWEPGVKAPEGMGIPHDVWPGWNPNQISGGQGQGVMVMGGGAPGGFPMAAQGQFPGGMNMGGAGYGGAMYPDQAQGGMAMPGGIPGGMPPGMQGMFGAGGPYGMGGYPGQGGWGGGYPGGNGGFQ